MTRFQRHYRRWMPLSALSDRRWCIYQISSQPRWWYAIAATPPYAAATHHCRMAALAEQRFFFWCRRRRHISSRTMPPRLLMPTLRWQIIRGFSPPSFSLRNGFAVILRLLRRWQIATYAERRRRWAIATLFIYYFSRPFRYADTSRWHCRLPRFSLRCQTFRCHFRSIISPSAEYIAAKEAADARRHTWYMMTPAAAFAADIYMVDDDAEIWCRWQTYFGEGAVAERYHYVWNIELLAIASRRSIPFLAETPKMMTPMMPRCRRKAEMLERLMPQMESPHLSPADTPHTFFANIYRSILPSLMPPMIRWPKSCRRHAMIRNGIFLSAQHILPRYDDIITPRRHAAAQRRTRQMAFHDDYIFICISFSSSYYII